MWASAMEASDTEGRTFMQAISEKYSPENFPCRRGPGMGVVVPSGQQGSPMKGKFWVNLKTNHVRFLGNLVFALAVVSCCCVS